MKDRASKTLLEQNENLKQSSTLLESRIKFLQASLQSKDALIKELRSKVEALWNELTPSREEARKFQSLKEIHRKCKIDATRKDLLLQQWKSKHQSIAKELEKIHNTRYISNKRPNSATNYLNSILHVAYPQLVSSLKSSKNTANQKIDHMSNNQPEPSSISIVQNNFSMDSTSENTPALALQKMKMDLHWTRGALEELVIGLSLALAAIEKRRAEDDYKMEM